MLFYQYHHAEILRRLATSQQCQRLIGTVLSKINVRLERFKAVSLRRQTSAAYCSFCASFPFGLQPATTEFEQVVEVTNLLLPLPRVPPPATTVSLVLKVTYFKAFAEALASPIPRLCLS